MFNQNNTISNDAVYVNININSHSSIQIDDLFFDPFETKNVTKKARYIFLTHTHYDHLSIEDIKNVLTSDTIFIATEDAKEKLEIFNNKVIYVKPNKKYKLDDFEFETFPAYNIDKNFHKKENGWVGYKLFYNGVTYAIVGDSDATPELENLKCDVLFIPVGGTYTMNAKEASTLTNIIMPQIAIPTHYGSIVGVQNDAKIFANNLNENIICKTFI